ncbi:MAG: hypothetical protein ACREH8_10570, partial [Opitutaceae bacterium]
MNSSNANPALPTWVFIATDLTLIGIAAAIALLSPYPLSTGAVFLIVAFVVLGAIAGLVPLVARYERQKNEALDERQSSLEALARTVSSSAEQISIAANGLHQVAELAHKNLRAAEQLPHKLHERIAEFQAQLSAAADAEKEELERELLALRTTESERLESVSQRIAKSAAEWAKLEAATQQHLTAANEAVARLALGTANAIGKAQAAAEQALSHARIEAARALGETSGNATRAIESAKSSALAELDAKLGLATATFVERITAALNAERASAVPPIVRADAVPDPAPHAASPPLNPAPKLVPAVDVSTATAASTSDAPVAQPPTRQRKPPREDPPASRPAGEADTSSSEPVSPPVETPTTGTEEVTPQPFEEPVPVPAHAIPEITPVAPKTAEPFGGHVSSDANGSASPVPPETRAESTASSTTGE